MNALQVSQEVQTLFRDFGDSDYGGEAVTQREHALQAALLAEQVGADDHLVVAALLHDIGHLLHNLPSDSPDKGVDDLHEELAASWLTERFAASVTEPVRMHVDAKRYLCAVDADYLETLSEPSRISLQLQGGPMDEEEAARFRSNPHFEDAIKLRHWDDEAKIAGLQTPTIETYLERIEKLATSC